jgi:hypothetical protein
VHWYSTAVASTGCQERDRLRRHERVLLCARIDELEAEIFAFQRAANLAAADAEERNYWIDRWQVDPQSAARKPILRAILRLVRVSSALLRVLSRLGQTR